MLWVKQAKRLIYDTLGKTNKPFQLMASTGPLIVLPAHFMDEVRNDDRMTFAAALKKDFFSNYPGFEGFRPAVDNHVFTKSVRIGLTQAIGQVTELLSQEMAGMLRGMWPVKDEWTSTKFNQDALAIIARLSSRIFLPEPLCHDPEWLDIAVNYTVDFFTAAFTLRMWPKALRPFVHWVLPQTRKIRKEVATATRLIEPELSRRSKVKAEALAAGKETPKYVDALAWMEAAAGEQAGQYNYVWGQLNYSLGAIHTTSMTFVYVVYDLIEHPEYIPLLREEIAAVWKPGDVLTKNVLYNLKLMDSFMKESQRLSPVTLMPMNRVAHENVTLSDGTVIPKGAGLGIPITAMTDEKYHKDPLTFDGHRFYNLRQQPGNETKYQFVTTSNDHIAFGHGKHACPGRFFASNEIKIALVQMLTTYDFRFPPGKGRPISLENGASMVPDPNGQIQYRHIRE
ncbi:hypothetical protein LTR47_009519 [Exophiala xenobiotica]|nr:hypothetical protein LTR47_009519 [Exophiala xenobiotica]KAK5249914.1 hypothetical protein LTS06_005269 [Exophiala xenobiotica]KAK5322062.1 hypothetical protein LTR93_006300 [Exophiala xenobiotica]KAK5346898.1 hypothetical protein LTR61_009339 [Exophiala xenobiotica]KAK5360746.1 hypothetical protein LTR11_010082 [Exophiala xenobiotica]